MFAGNGELIEAMNSAGVRFLIVGGVAVHFYAREREYDDLDMLLEKTVENATRFIAALSRWPLTTVALETLIQSDKVQISLKAFHYADVLTHDAEFDFDNAWLNANSGTINGYPVRVISKDQLIVWKTESGRTKDTADLLILQPNPPEYSAENQL